MVNKGRIHGEMRDFREIFWNLIKSNDELVIEIRENSRFRKIIKDKSTKTKITRFGLVFADKSKSEVERNFRKSEERKTKINDEIKLNYDLKLQIDDT